LRAVEVALSAQKLLPEDQFLITLENTMLFRRTEPGVRALPRQHDGGTLDFRYANNAARPKYGCRQPF
jgi:hypothetical protein